MLKHWLVRYFKGMVINCHECNSGQSLNVLVGPGVENRVQLAAIDCHSVACVLEEQKCEVTREGPRDLRVSTKSGVSRVFLEWIQVSGMGDQVTQGLT